MPLDQFSHPVANDPVAAAVEGHLRSMEEAGQGEFTMDREGEEIVLAFGEMTVRGETYDVALLRLASALLDSVDLGALFLARMRNPARNPPAANLRDNLVGVRKATERQ